MLHMAGGESAPFDQPFHLLLNLAVGGHLPGDPDASAFPGRLLVDYVRAYQCAVDPASGVGCGGLADQVDESIRPTPASDVFRRQYVLYGDALGALALADDAPAVALDFGIGDDGAVVLSEADEGGRGRVVDVKAGEGGRLAIRAADSSRQQFFGIGNPALATPLAGELQFDLYIFGAATELDGAMRIGLDSGPANAGFVELPIRHLLRDEWTTVTVQISDVVRNPHGAVDLDRVLGLFALTFTGVAHVRLDDIRILCAHSQQGGCGIAAL